MNSFMRWLDALANMAHDSLKWLLSALSAALTLGFVFVLEAA